MIRNVDEAYNIGAANSFTVAERPENEYGSGFPDALPVVFARFVPNTPSSIPGLTVVAYEAAFATPEIAVPDVLPPSTNITGTFTYCGTAFALCSTIVAR